MMAKVALMAVAAMSLAAVQDAEMIQNPEYKGWSGQKTGAWVKFTTVVEAGTMKMESATTTTLKEITAEKAVLEQATEMDQRGERRTTTLPARDVPARIKKGTDSDGGKIEVIAEGGEELELKGTKYKCHWVEMKLAAKRGGEGTMKIWRSDKIIGGAAKMTMKTAKMTMTMNVVDWKAGE
jgi:hypothetical protein